MKAAVQTGIGDVDQIELREVPEPKPGPGEVKIKVAAVSINPIDWKMLHGPRAVQTPWIMGFDVAGEIVETGSGVAGFKAGDRVLGNVPHTFAEYVIAQASDVAAIPEQLSMEEAAAIPLVTTTGSQLIEEHTRPRPDETVLVTGALGGVGRTAVYAAKRRGAKVLAGVRRSQLDEAARLGADGVVAIDDPAAIEKLPALDAIADTVGGDTIDELLPHLKKGGKLGSVLGEPSGAKGRDIIVDAFRAHPDGHRLSELAMAVARGELTIPIGRQLPMTDVRAATRWAEAGHAGKVVMTL